MLYHSLDKKCSHLCWCAYLHLLTRSGQVLFAKGQRMTTAYMLVVGEVALITGGNDCRLTTATTTARGMDGNRTDNKVGYKKTGSRDTTADASSGVTNEADEEDDNEMDHSPSLQLTNEQLISVQRDFNNAQYC